VYGRVYGCMCVYIVEYIGACVCIVENIGACACIVRYIGACACMIGHMHLYTQHTQALFSLNVTHKTQNGDFKQDLMPVVAGR
jgi:hypothetical protein